jgi:RNA polymerase sigma-70 factor (ECF subfamily)
MPQTLLNEAQLTAIYRDTIDALYGYVSRRCGGVRQLAEDLTQETWLRAVREWGRAGAPDKPLAWLTTVARNLIINHFRRTDPVALDDLPLSMTIDTVDLDAIGESEAIAALVNQALSRLPMDEARLLEEFHFERYRVTRLAERYGISERAVEGRLRRARERLRRELELAQPTLKGGLS